MKHWQIVDWLEINPRYLLVGKDWHIWSDRLSFWRDIERASIIIDTQEEKVVKDRYGNSNYYDQLTLIDSFRED